MATRDYSSYRAKWNEEKKAKEEKIRNPDRYEGDFRKLEDQVSLETEPVSEPISIEQPAPYENPVDQARRIKQENPFLRALGLVSQGNIANRAVDSILGPDPMRVEPVTDFDRGLETAGSFIQDTVIGGKILEGVAPLVGGGAKKAVDLARALPDPLKITAGAGAAVGGTQAVIGATNPEMKDASTFTKAGASFRAGVGDILTTAGSAAEWQGWDDLGQSLGDAGQSIKEGYEIQPEEFSWRSFFKPDFYAVNVTRALPLTLSLLPAMYGGYKLGGAAGGKLGLTPFKKAILSSITGAGFSRPLESAMEAGSAYEEAIARGMDRDKAEEAANSVFKKNLALVGLDAAQLTAAFAPAPFKATSKLGRAALGAGRIGADTLLEAGEEGVQEVFQRQAVGDPVAFDARMQESMAIGGIFGAGMGGAGAAVDALQTIQERTIQNLPPDMQTQVQNHVDQQVRSGVDPTEAVEKALDAVADTVEGKAVIDKAVQEVSEEMNRRVMPREAAREKYGTLSQKPAGPIQAQPVSGKIVYGPQGVKLEVVDDTDPSLLTVRNEQGTEFKIGRRAVKEVPPVNAVAPEPVTTPEPAIAPPQGAQGVVESIPSPEAVSVPQGSSREDLSVIGDAGKAIADNMYEMMWGRVQKGKTTEAGQQSVYLQVGKILYDSGAIKSIDDFKKVTREVSDIRDKELSGEEYQRAIKGIVEKYQTRPKEPAAPATATPPQKKDTRTDEELVQAVIEKAKAQGYGADKITVPFVVHAARLKDGRRAMGIADKVKEAMQEPVGGAPQGEVEVPEVSVQAGEEVLSQEAKSEPEQPQTIPPTVPEQQQPSDNLSDRGLTLTQTTTKNGKPAWQLTGDTKPIKEELKRAGGRWYKPHPKARGVWTFYGEDDPTARILKALPVVEKKQEDVKQEVHKYGRAGNAAFKKWGRNEYVNANLDNAEEPYTQAFKKFFEFYYSAGLNNSRPQYHEIPDIGEFNFPPFLEDEFYKAGQKDYEAGQRSQKPPAEPREERQPEPVQNQNKPAEPPSKTPETSVESLQKELYDRLSKNKAVINAAKNNDKDTLGIEVRQSAKKIVGEMVVETSQGQAEGFEQVWNAFNQYESISDVTGRVEKDLWDKYRGEPAKEAEPSERGTEPAGQPEGAGLQETGPEPLGEVPAEDDSGTGQGRKTEGGSRSSGPANTDGRKADQGRTAEKEPTSGERLPEEGPAPGVGEEDGRGDGAPGVDTPAGREGSNRERPERDVQNASRTGTNYVITPEDALGKGGPKTKAKANVEAIKLVKQLEAEGRAATLEEQQKLVKYTGWGGIPQIFDIHKKDWGAEREELKGLLTKEEYDAAKRSTQNAHYTSPAIIQAMYKALEHFGFKGGRVLEPSMGIGHFFGLMPPEMRSKSRLTGIELDKITGLIAKHLYPQAGIHIDGFENVALANDTFDVVISNVPFGKIKIADKGYPEYLRRQIHNYFFVKSLDKVRPGGLVMFITSTGTLDSLNNEKIRQYITSKADVIGAVRLPGDTFKENAGTEVTTDIIVLKKRAKDQPPAGEAIISTVDSGIENNYGRPLDVNEYYVNHPEMLLGKLVQDKLHYNRIGMESDGRDVLAAMEEAFKKLPGDIITKIERKEKKEQPRDVIAAPDDMKEGAFVIRDGKVFQKRGKELISQGLSADKVKKIVTMIDIRQAARELLRSQYEGKSDEVVTGFQKRLNSIYDSFVKNYGRLNEKNNISLFENDPDSSLLLALETVQTDAKGNTVISKADIFTKRTIHAHKPVDKAETAKEALVISLNETGGVDWEKMTSLTGKSEKDLQQELKGLVFKNPEGTWETEDSYLSGNVRAKLAIARAAAVTEPRYQENVEALEAVQPVDLKPEEIGALLGAPWIPQEYIEEFANGLINVPEGLSIRNVPGMGAWFVKVKENRKYAVNNSVANVRKWGTDDVPAHELIEKSLNHKIPIIKRKEKTSEGERVYVDEEATAAARKKQKQIEEEFKKWVWTDKDRTDLLVKKYNEEFNNLRLRTYDGSHLTFPGMNTSISLRPHQKNAVWRVLQGRNALLAHVVGAGKTYTMIAAAMEAKRLGISKKSMFVVPLHLVNQWERDFRYLYPSANTLVLTSDRLPDVRPSKQKGESKEAYAKKKTENTLRREVALNRIVTGDWDAIIIPHNLFTRLPVTPEWKGQFIQQQIDDLEDVLEEMRAEEGSRYTVKRIENAKQNLETKLAQTLSDDNRKDIVTPFEELGIDTLFVDESHEFKNLQVTTRMQNVKGVPSSEADKAMDMFIKTQWLAGINNGKGVVFATGTPITNTMGEMYNLQKYLAMDDLRSHNLTHFDSWAATFGETITKPELSADSRTYKDTTSFSQFSNVAELMQLFRSFADIQMQEQLDLPRPELKGGAREKVIADPSKELEQYVERLIARMESFKGRYDPKVDNPLKVVGDGRKAALDMRLIDPSLPDYLGSKVNVAVKNIVNIWKRTKKDKSTQLVFLDLSTPKAESKEEAEASDEDTQNISVYNDIKSKLIGLGIPKNEIAFIHDFKKPEQKKKLFDDVNAGRVRVLIGSTAKMGAGMNVQKKCIALHHLDCPWRPSDIEQREGRILRQGNDNPQVEIYAYATKGSFDNFMWGKVEGKARFVAQVMAGGTGVRTMEDVEAVVMGLAEMKAATSGNPLVEEKFKVDGEVRTLQLEQSHHYDSQRSMKRRLNKDIPNQLTHEREELEKFQKDLATKQDTRGDKFKITINSKTYTKRADAEVALKKALKKVKRSKEAIVTEKVGTFAGFDLRFEKRPVGSDYWVINGEKDYSRMIEADDNILSSIEATMRLSIENTINRITTKIAELEKEATDLKKEIGAPWADQDKLNELLVRQREIDRQLGIGPTKEEDVITGSVEGESEAAAASERTGEDDTFSMPSSLRKKVDKILENRITDSDKGTFSLASRHSPQKTSINQVAAGLRTAATKGIFKEGMIVADVGGGLWEKGTEYLAEKGVTNLVYDPYARSPEHNEGVLKRLEGNGGADAASLNNVLNVIPTDEERADVLKFLYQLLKPGGQAVISVYEGNRSGKGARREFSDGTSTWQENRSYSTYEEGIKAALPEATVEKKFGMFIVTKPAKNIKEDDTFYMARRGNQPGNRPVPQPAPQQPPPPPVQINPQDPSRLSPKAAREIADILGTSLDTVIRGARLGRAGRKSLGFFKRSEMAGRVKRRFIENWRVTGHELGHAFHFRAGFKPNQAEMKAIVQQFYPGGQAPQGKQTAEGLAEFIMLWFADNAVARQTAPKTAAKLEGFLNANPVLQEAFARAKAIADEDLAGTELERMRKLTVNRGIRHAPNVGAEYEIPWWKRPLFWFVDYTLPLKDLYKAAVKEGFTGLDPAKLAAISGMAREQAVDMFKNQARDKAGRFLLPGRRSLQEIAEEAAEVENGMILFNDIYKAMRYLERWNRMEARGEKDIALPQSKDFFQKVVDEANTNYPRLVELVEEYSEILSEINLRLLVRGGVISEENADRVRAGSKIYFPLYTVGRGLDVESSQRRSSGPGVRHFRGHSGQTLDIVEATIMRLSDGILAVEINRLMQHIQQALENDNMGVFGTIEDKPEVVKAISMRRLKGQLDKFLNSELDPDDEGRVVNLFMAGGISDTSKNEPILMARYGDSSVYMRVAPDLYKSVLSMKPVTFDFLAKVLSKLAMVSRIGALANIRYVTNAVMRDWIGSKIQSQTPERNVALGLIRGALVASGRAENAEEIMSLYVQSGAFGSSVQEVLDSLGRSVRSDGLISTPAPGWKRTAINTFVRVVRSPLDALRIIEEAPRIPEFQEVMRRGLEELNLTTDDLRQGDIPEAVAEDVEKLLVEAAYASREVLVNFGLHGVNESFRKYARTVPFLQGGVQGIYREMRQVKEKPGATMVSWLKYVLPITLIAWALNHRDDRYRDMPSTSRDLYWWFPVSDSFQIAVAKPYFYSIGANILERFLDWGINQDDPNRRKPFDDILKLVDRTFLPPMKSMVVDTILALMTNKDFMGSPIEPQREEKFSNAMKYGPGNSETAVLLAKMYAALLGENGPSPRQIDYFVKGIFGGVGKTGLALTDKLIPGENPGGKKVGIEYAPLVGGLLYGPGERGSRITDRFYKDYDRAQKLYNDAKQKSGVKGDKAEDTAKMLSAVDPEDRKYVQAIPAMRAIADDMADLRKELRELNVKPDVTAERKRQAGLKYNWMSKVAAGYLYGQPVPAAAPELGITEAQAQDVIEYYDHLTKKAMKNAAKKPGGPI